MICRPDVFGFVPGRRRVDTHAAYGIDGLPRRRLRMGVMRRVRHSLLLNFLGPLELCWSASYTFPLWEGQGLKLSQEGSFDEHRHGGGGQRRHRQDDPPL